MPMPGALNPHPGWHCHDKVCFRHTLSIILHAPSQNVTLSKPGPLASMGTGLPLRRPVVLVGSPLVSTSIDFRLQANLIDLSSQYRYVHLVHSKARPSAQCWQGVGVAHSTGWVSLPQPQCGQLLPWRS